jgi:hypothetical protein
MARATRGHDASKEITTYRIDLAKAPETRYTEMATDFGPLMKEMTVLFDDIVASIFPWKFLQPCIKFLARISLRRLYDPEQTQEAKGIAAAAGVELYLVIALNVLLDALMGCTSGCVTVAPETSSKSPWGFSENPAHRLMHFRTLDWGMDQLRNLIVVLEYVDSSSSQPERIIARSISYAGFVGVLTGVR